MAYLPAVLLMASVPASRLYVPALRTAVSTAPLKARQPLSATPADAETNTNLLENRRWMDLAVVYGTGRNAIITLEKDEEAQALFENVFATWAE